MRETLYLRLRDTAPDAPTPHALVVDGAVGVPPSVVVRHAPLAEALKAGAGHRIVAFVPGADVRLTAVNVPARQPAKILQAAPFVLEEQFADDVETLHFALGARQPDGSHAIAAVARTQMEAWLAVFEDAGAMPAMLVPDTMALPWSPELPWSVLAEAGQITCRTSATGGFACVPEDFSLYLEMAEGGTPHPLRVLLPRGVADDFSTLGRPVELLPGFDDPLDALVRHFKPPTAINLLQGVYSQRENLDRFWKPWRLAASLLAAAFVLGVAVNGVQALRYRHQTDAQVAANEAKFRALFPTEQRIVDLQAQLDQQLRALRAGNGGGGLFFLMQQAAAGITASPGLTLKGIQFRDGALLLDLSSTDVQTVEKLRSYFASHRGASLTVQDTTSVEGATQVRAKLTAAAT